ncbi:hypothetical protein O3P69_018724 [Scylla paramamosain]|uniref:Uncharacterized protein n=1 Tax=Scylla paramamosain TaxID=85552 RepID=A0AAW0SSV3_SCYPA
MNVGGVEGNRVRKPQHQNLAKSVSKWYVQEVWVQQCAVWTPIVLQGGLLSTLGSGNLNADNQEPRIISYLTSTNGKALDFFLYQLDAPLHLMKIQYLSL